MFKIIFQIILLVYIIFVIHSFLEIQKYNPNGYLMNYNTNISDTHEGLKSLNPVQFNNHFISSNQLTEFSLNINDIPTLINLKEEKHINIFKNKELINIFNVYEHINIIDHIFFQDNKLLIPIHKSISIYKDYYQKELIKCLHNYNIIHVISGETKIFLFNPKHEKEIIHKNNTEIKKWGQRVIIQENDTIIIPTNWYYFIETEKDVILYHTDIDTYFTFIPNLLKKKYISYQYLN
tara:strand:- start:436 stop:1143 length:708 start_codon:yes stop_codon:yes gene_type:complete